MPFLLKEILFATGAAALALWFIVDSQKLIDSAAMMPRILATLIIVLSVVMVGKGWIERRRMLKAGQKEEIPYINIPRVTLFVIFILAYVLCIEPLGYFIATPIFIIGTYLYLRALSLGRSLLVMLAFCALVYGLFVRFLHLPLPMGLFETLLG